MIELKPCPFCGGEVVPPDFEDGDCVYWIDHDKECILNERDLTFAFYLTLKSQHGTGGRTMPTNDERREIAARLRELYPSGVLPPSSQVRIDICYTIGCGFGQEHQVEKIHERLADLIEPEPERTCQNVTHDPEANYFKCDACDCEVTDYDDYKVWITDAWNYCPNCGAKVVSE